MSNQMPSPPTPVVLETSLKITSHQLRFVRESVAQMESLGNTQKDVVLWFQLFSDILDDEQLTEKLGNTIKVVVGDEGNPEEFIVSNLP